MTDNQKPLNTTTFFGITEIPTKAWKELQNRFNAKNKKLKTTGNNKPETEENP